MVPTYQLVIHSGPMAGKVFLLEKNETFIGRDLSNDIVINDPEVSRRHARVYLQGGNYVIEDLGSTNGTTVNGQRLMGPHVLRPGELVVLGEHVNLLFEASAPEEEATVVAPVVEQQPVAAARPAYTPAYAAPAVPAAARRTPVATPPPEPVASQTPRQIPVWVLVVGLLLVLFCVCVVAFIAIDSLNLWCVLFGWFFGPEACPAT